MKGYRLMALAVVAMSTAMSMAPADAPADTLCVKRSGRVVARAGCRRKERPFDPVALGFVGPAGPSGPAGPAGAPGAPGGHPYRVVDAEGRVFGTTIGYDGVRARVAVSLPGVDHPVQFVVAHGGFYYYTELPDAVAYKLPDCTGTPYVAQSMGPVPPVVVVGDVGYFATTAPRAVPVASIEYFDEEGCAPEDVATNRGTCCWNGTDTEYAAPARSLSMASLGVTLPLTVQR